MEEKNVTIQQENCHYLQLTWYFKYKTLKFPPQTYKNWSMNSIQLQETRLVYRNLLIFYMLMVNYQKKKVKNQSLLKSHFKNT